jgi:DHA1 family bicyclomycin/chloramphenicol resistance-like MFS transporter
MPLTWLLVLGSIVAIGPLSIDMYLPALPDLQRHFGTTTASVQLTLASFFVGLAAGQLFYGPLADRFGRKPPLMAGLALFCIASLACAMATSVDALIVLRLLQALGGCAGTVITRAIVRDRSSPEELARTLSRLVLVMGAAPMLAPLAGSAVLQFGNWRLIFVVLALFGAMAAYFAWRVLPETHAPQRRLRSLTVRSAALGYGQLMRHRKFLGYALSGGIAQGGMFAYISSGAFVFITGYGLTPTQFSILFAVNASGLIAASQFNAMVLRRRPAQQVLLMAMRTYFGAAFVMLVSAATGIGGMLGIAIPLWVCLASLGFTFPNSIAAAMAPFGDRAGSASALMGTLQFAVAGLASYAVGRLPAGATAMAAVIAVCGALSNLVLRSVVRRPA